jgi:hypothetical protein
MNSLLVEIARFTSVIRFSPKTLICICIFFVSACSESSTSNQEFRTVPFTSTQSQAAIGENGAVAADFELAESATSIQLVSRSRGRNIRIQSLRGPQGRILFDTANDFDASITMADSFSSNLNVFNFPIIGQQNLSSLPAGIYQVSFLTQLTAGNQSSAPVEDTLSLTVLSKKDDDVTQGMIALRVFQSEVVASSDDLQTSFNNALDVTREMFSRVGLSLTVNIRYDAAVPETLPNPAQGAALYERGSLLEGGYIPVYLATNVSGLNAPLNSIAQAGSIPGPLVPSQRSAIAVSMLRAGGSDTIIDSEQDRDDPGHTSEVRLLGEALAHEILHYLGLQDTIVFTGSIASEGDGIDSPKCLSIEDCQYDSQSPHNLMFPFPLERIRGAIRNPSEQDQYIPREDLATMQTLIAQLALGTD